MVNNQVEVLLFLLFVNLTFLNHSRRMYYLYCSTEKYPWFTIRQIMEIDLLKSLWKIHIDLHMQRHCSENVLEGECRVITWEGRRQYLLWPILTAGTCLCTLQQYRNVISSHLTDGVSNVWEMSVVAKLIKWWRGLRFAHDAWCWSV